ncbi:Enolase [Perilla frutescens var. hirtella]|uniref:phosphopyruvate hydratase n=1 Tax=Perilla frutescens var. hirtella TaxID=608512 RepID=A0AAD4NYA6_PERFH|nr:Enolase [Perilla frutescens var. hirtella]
MSKYPIMSLKDLFDQDDWEHYTKMTTEIGAQVQIVGDDLLVTNPKRVEKAIKDKSCNSLLLKVNQIGSVNESIEAVKMSKHVGLGVMASHCSGETDDTFITDLSVGLATCQIKTGAPCRSEQFAKYNQLLRIEEVELVPSNKGELTDFETDGSNVEIKKKIVVEIEQVSFNSKIAAELDNQNCAKVSKDANIVMALNLNSEAQETDCSDVMEMKSNSANSEESTKSNDLLVAMPSNLHLMSEEDDVVNYGVFLHGVILQIDERILMNDK